MIGDATPPCPHFGPCGGCQLQHLAYSDQLAGKAAQLSTLLAGHAPRDLQLHPSPALAYRNRIRLTLGEVDGELRAGYMRAAQPQHGAHAATQINFLPITQCPIAAPLLWRGAEVVLERINAQPALWLGDPQQRLDQLELFTTADESALQFTLTLRTRGTTIAAQTRAGFDRLCDELRARVPELTGAGISLLPPARADRSRRAETPHPGPAWGKPGVTYRVGDLDYWVPRTAFFQANRFLLPELVATVSAGQTGALAWDLFAGVGLFSRALARTFAQVTAVEIAEPAASALGTTKLANLHAVKATTLDFLRAASIQRERPALVVLDPPRTGLGAEVCSLLERVAAPTLVYVSCNAQALAQDLAALTGYAVAELHLFDLFPQTNHMETVAILRRTG